MSTWRSQIDVQAEPEQVLETLTDVEACEAWSPVGFEVDGLDSGRLSAGTEVSVSGAIAGCRVRFRVEIVLADSERLVLRAAGPVEMLAHYVVRPAAEGSRLDAAISVRRGTGAGARLAARTASILLGAGALKQTLARIAREAERRHDLAAPKRQVARRAAAAVRA
jgi:carbon monoxide dehydrogenase subunit G